TMKKRLLLSTLVFSLVLTLAACGSNSNVDSGNKNEGNNQNENNEEPKQTLVAGGALQDGTYSLEEKEISDKGWKTTFEIKVENGKIVSSNYNYVNADGKLKTDDENYQKAMSDKTGVGPQDFIPALNKQLVDTQDAQKVEVVTGATHSSESFLN